MRWFVKESRFASHPEMRRMVGWGNGYVVVDKDNKWYGKDYEQVECQIHGGLTFGQKITAEMLEHWPELNPTDLDLWLFGFDTAHYGDNPTEWPQSRVEDETKYLYTQLM